jgi:hypothetical protein
MKDEFKELSQHLSRLTEENHTTPQSKQQISGPTFQF